MMLRTLLTIAIAGVVSACSPYAPSLGNTPFECGTTDPQCPDGYSCKTMGTKLLCMSDSPSSVDSGSGTGFPCADDSVLEGPSRNDTVATSSTTPVASTRASITYGGLAICPNGDKDTYRVDGISAAGNQTLTATVTYDPITDGGVALSVAVLNMSGIAIAQGSPMGTNTVVVKVTNVTANSQPYYVSVFGPPMGENNYKLTIAVQ